MMGFLAALPSKYDFVKAQILASPEISSFQETFSKIIRTETYSCTPTQIRSALVGWNNGESETQQYRNSSPDGNSRGTSSREVVYYYYHKPGHVIRYCKKWQSRNQRLQSAHVASTNEASDPSVQFSSQQKN